MLTLIQAHTITVLTYMLNLFTHIYSHILTRAHTLTLPYFRWFRGLVFSGLHPGSERLRSAPHHISHQEAPKGACYHEPAPPS